MTKEEKKEFFSLMDDLMEDLAERTDLCVQFIAILINSWEKMHAADAVLSVLVPAMTLAGKNIDVKSISSESGEE